MYFALVDYRSSCVAMTGLSFGTLDDIKEELLNNGDLIIQDMFDDMTREEMEEEGDDVEDYYFLKETDEVTFEMINRYSFSVSDCTTDVCALTDDYQKLREMFGEYTADKMVLDEWELPEELELTRENLEELDSELRMVTESTDEERVKLLKRKC